MSEESKNILIENLSLKDYTKVTGDISKLEEDIRTGKEIINELTKENERLNQNNQSYQEEMTRTWKIADNYKSRCNKAIEYIKKLQENDDIEIWRENGYWAYILNILQGSDKE